MLTDCARPPVFEDNVPYTEPLTTSQGLQAYPPGDDVAPVLAVLHTDCGLSFDVIEVLGRDEGYFADPAEAAPVSGPGTVAITLQTATFECSGRRRTRRTARSWSDRARETPTQTAKAVPRNR